MGKRLFAMLAALMLFVPAAPASARVYAKDISFQFVNNSQTTVHVAFCPNGHVNIAYQVGRVSNPCNITPYQTDIAGNGGRLDTPYTANPLGMVMTVKGQTVYFYVSNPQIGKPFFEINGQKVSMVEGEMQVRHAGSVQVRFHRGGDTDKKVMMIEIQRV